MEKWQEEAEDAQRQVQALWHERDDLQKQLADARSVIAELQVHLCASVLVGESACCVMLYAYAREQSSEERMDVVTGAAAEARSQPR